MKKKVVVSILILIVLFIFVFMFLPFESGGRVVISDCNDRGRIILYDFYTEENLLISKKINSSGELEIDSIIWGGCGSQSRKNFNFNYTVQEDKLLIKNYYVSNWAEVLWGVLIGELSGNYSVACVCPHRATYYISDFQDSNYSIIVRGQVLKPLSDEEREKLIEILNTLN